MMTKLTFQKISLQLLCISIFTISGCSKDETTTPSAATSSTSTSSSTSTNTETATCSDGIQNQGEEGVDCGGPCPKCEEQSENGWVVSNVGTTATLRSVDFVDNNIGWVVGNYGTILKTTDGGDSWNSQSSPIMSNLYEVSFIDANTGWIAGKSGVMKTIDGGSNWIIQYTPPQYEYMYSVHFVDANTGWAVGSEGRRIKTTDGGSTWTEQTGGLTYGDETISDVYFVDQNVGFAVGVDGGSDVALGTTDGGSTWTYLYSGITCPRNGVFALDQNRFWIVGKFNYESFDGSYLLSMQVSSGKESNDVFFTDINNGWVVGDDGTISHTTDGGSTFSLDTTTTTVDLYEVTFIGKSHGWIVGSNGTLLTLKP